MVLNLFESFSISSEAKNSLKKLLFKMKSRWQEVHRKNDVFLERNRNWFKTSITVSVSNSLIFENSNCGSRWTI